MATGDSGCEAYTAIAWGVGLSHERSDVAGAECFYSPEGFYEVAITLCEEATKQELQSAVGDLIDYAKSIALISNAGPKHLRRLVIQWGEQHDAPEGCRLELRELQAPAPRR